METARKQPNRVSYLAMAAGFVLLAAGLSAAAKVLVIYGNSNGTVNEGSYSLGDAWVKQNLETALHHQARCMWDQRAKEETPAAADSADPVVGLESPTPAYRTDKLKPPPVPILDREAMIQDDSGLTATGTSC